MKLGQIREHNRPVNRADRRLLGGFLVSLLLHALILLLQFGVPGHGWPGTPVPLTVVIAQADTAVAPAPSVAVAADPVSAGPVPLAPVSPAPAPVPLDPVVPLPVPAPAGTGMRLVDPLAAPEPAPAPAAVQAKPIARKDEPRRAKRISSPLIDDMLDDSARVIAQDATLNEFNVPLARPEEADQKTIDPKQAQHGDDDGDATANAALEAQAAVAGARQAAAEELARKLAEQEAAARRAAAERELQASQEQTKRDNARVAQQALQEQQNQQNRLKQQSQQKAELDAAAAKEQQVAEQRELQQRAEQQRAELAKLEQQTAEQLRQEQQREQLAKAEQQRLQQQRLEQQRAEQQRAEEQRAEQQRAEQQQAEQQRAEQQRADQQRAEQQRAEQQRAEQQRAEQQRAAQQRAGEEAARNAAERSRNLTSAPPGSGGTGGPAAGAGGGTVQIPKNMLGSDAAYRARDMVRGLDLLRGAPPAPRSRGERRIAVGASERDLPLKMYAESWRQKIERNGAVNYPRSWADVVRIDPLVSVAVRSDGSVEDVTILVSSGHPDMDEAVRRIVRVNARYSPFPPQIAERYDVIEIRRIWRFDDKLRLLEELR